MYHGEINFLSHESKRLVMGYRSWVMGMQELSMLCPCKQHKSMYCGNLRNLSELDRQQSPIFNCNSLSFIRQKIEELLLK
jgi:hypothetical protein